MLCEQVKVDNPILLLFLPCILKRYSKQGHNYDFRRVQSMTFCKCWFHVCVTGSSFYGVTYLDG